MANAATDADPDANPEAAPERALGMWVPRTRGVVSGVVLALAGTWAALAPFVGPAFHFAYTPKPGQTWHWTAARGWYEVLPGGLAVLGGLLLIVSANRIVTTFGAVIAALAGGWLVVGQQVSYLLTLGSPGAPSAKGDRRYVAEYLAFFTGLGALIVFFAALALGRLSVRSVRDLRAAARRDEQGALADREAAGRDDDYRRADEDRGVTDRNAENWAAGERGGYGTPGTTEPLPRGADGSPSAVTTELPAAGAVGAYAAGRYDDDSQRDYRRDEPGYGRGRDAGPDDDTAALPVVGEDGPRATETSARVEGNGQPEPVHEPEPRSGQELQHEPEPEPEPEGVRDAEPGWAAAAAPQQQAAAPIVLDPPEGHSARRSRTRSAGAPSAAERPDDAEHANAAEHVNNAERPDDAEHATAAEHVNNAAADPAPTSGSASVWNPEAQSPTTTGELPAIGSNPPEPPAAEHPGAGPSPAEQPPGQQSPGQQSPGQQPPVEPSPAAQPAAEQPQPEQATAPSRGVAAPRRYFGSNNADAQQDAPGAAEPAPVRDAVRTDEADDLDFNDVDLNDVDLDERPH